VTPFSRTIWASNRLFTLDGPTKFLSVNMSRLRKCRPTHAVVSLVHTCRHVGRHFSIGRLSASADKFLCRCPSPIYWPDLSTRRFYIGRYENVGCGGVVQRNANISTNVIVQPDNYVGPYSRRTVPTPKERKAIPCPCSQLVQFRHPILPRFAVIIFLKGTSPLELRKICSGSESIEYSRGIPIECY